jgi:hypothetical protein
VGATGIEEEEEEEEEGWRAIREPCSRNLEPGNHLS